MLICHYKYIIIIIIIIYLFMYDIQTGLYENENEILETFL